MNIAQTKFCAIYVEDGITVYIGNTEIGKVDKFCYMGKPDNLHCMMKLH